MSCILFSEWTRKIGRKASVTQVGFALLKVIDR